MRRLLIGASALGLAACGGGADIDAKNADTFAETLRSMTADLSQEDRRTAGTGFYLVVEEQADGHTPNLSTLRSARNNALDVLPSGDAEQARFQMGLYQQVIDTAGEELDGMSLRDLERYVEDYEERAFEAEADAATQQVEALASAANSASAKQRERDAEVDRLTAETEAPMQLAEQMVEGVRLLSVEPQSNNSRLNVKPAITVTNLLDFPIDHVNVRFALEADGFEKPFAMIAQTYLARSDEGVLPPGETRELTYSERGFNAGNRQRDVELPADPAAYTVTAYIDQARGSGEAWYPRADREITRELNQAKRTAEQCQQAITAANQEVVALDARAEAFRRGEDPGSRGFGYGRGSVSSLARCQ